MENELISENVEQKIIKDIEQMIKKGGGEILLDDYVSTENDSCLDFAMVYEASEDLKYFIEQQREKSIKIDIEEDRISISAK